MYKLVFTIGSINFIVKSNEKLYDCFNLIVKKSIKVKRIKFRILDRPTEPLPRPLQHPKGKCLGSTLLKKKLP